MKRTKENIKFDKYMKKYNIPRKHAAKFLGTIVTSISLKRRGDLRVTDENISDLLYCYYNSLIAIMGDLQADMEKEGIKYE